MFKIYDIDVANRTFIERVNLGASKNLNMDFSSNDVAWNALDENILATGAVNGAVVTWNLGLPSRTKKERTYQDHKRTVNALCFHPSQQKTLMSCSQDGTMKLFDLRSAEASLTLNSGSESVRDLQFSPHGDQDNLVAAVLEDGQVLIYDFRFARSSTRPVKSFTAHNGPVFSIDWHPTKKEWIATAGRDHTINVWNLYSITSSTASNSKNFTEYSISTIAPVARVRWQPGITYHIASSCLRTDFSVSVWDVRRPYMPYATFTEHTESARGFVWIDKFTLLSAGKDNTLYHHYFEEAIRPFDTANPVAFDFNGFGNITSAYSKPIKSVKVASSHDTSLTNETSSRPKSPFRSVPRIFSQSSAKAPAESVVTSFAKQDVPRIFFKSDLSNETLEPLSMRWFIETALRYELTGKSFDELCLHNSKVALALNRCIIHNIWLIILEIYGSRTRNPSIHTSSNSKQQNPLQSQISSSALHASDHCAIASNLFASRSDLRSLSFDQGASLASHLNQMSIDAPDCHVNYDLTSLSTSETFNSSVDKDSQFTTVAYNSNCTLDNLSSCEVDFMMSCKLMASSLVHPLRHVNGNQIVTMDNDDIGCITKRSHSISSNPTIGDFIDQSDSDESYVNIMPVDIGNSYSNVPPVYSSINSSNLSISTSKSTLSHPFYNRNLSNSSILANTYSSSHNFLYGDDEFKMNLQDALETLSDLTEGQVEQVTCIPEEAFIRKHFIADYPKPPNFDDVITPETPIVSPSSPLFSSSSGIDSLRSLVDNILSDTSLSTRKIRKIIRKSDPKILLKQIFYYLIGESDIQSVVSIVIILGGRINELSDYLDASVLEKWFTSYIELLHRFQLWTVATQIITLSNLPAINSLNQSSTTVKIICGVCTSRLPQGTAPVICKNCGTDNTLCSVCDKSVCGLFIWCGGCSHGGHLNCLYSSLDTSELCPYPGCDDRCEYTSYPF